MIRTLSALALFALIATALPPGPAAAPVDLGMRFSWSADTLSDTLVVTGSGWTTCYLWVTATGINEGFFGLWGTLRQTGAVQAHRFRSLLPGDEGERVLSPTTAEQRLAFLGVDCTTIAGAQAVFEFDVHIDAVALGDALRPSGLSIFATDDSDLDPLVFFRVDSGDPCGAYSEGFDAVTNGIVAVAGPVAAESLAFGAVKALYR